MLHAPSLQHNPALESAPFQTPRSPETAKQILAQSETLCRSRGARLTPIRRKVLEVLLDAAKPLGAYDLADAVALQGRRMAPITVYRALDFLIENGLVHRLASQNAYIACAHQHGPKETVAFLICENCGSVDEVTSAALSKTLSDVLEREKFTPHGQIIEITGRCADCDGKAE